MYPIGLTLTDDDTGSDTESTSVVVNNVSPVLNYLTVSPESINEDQSVSLSGSFIDPGTQDKHTLYINWGDGSAAQVIGLAKGPEFLQFHTSILTTTPPVQLPIRTQLLSLWAMMTLVPVHLKRGL